MPFIKFNNQMKIGFIATQQGKDNLVDIINKEEHTIIKHLPSKDNSSTLSTDLLDTSVIFINVPTPMAFNGGCHLEVIQENVDNLKKHNYPGHIIIRATVPPGTNSKYGTHYLPDLYPDNNKEFSNKTYLLGINYTLDNYEKLSNLLTTILPSITFDTVSVANLEVIKYTRNAFLATKVGFFNEIENYCHSKNFNFNLIRKYVCDDPRIGESHSLVPGPDGKKGFAGKSLMKDLTAFCLEMEKTSSMPIILRPVVTRNARKDRPNEKWFEPIPDQNKTQPQAVETTYTKELLNSFSISQLKIICQQRTLDLSDCVEKRHLIQKILDSTINNTTQPSTNIPRPNIPRHPGSNIPRYPGPNIPRHPGPNIPRHPGPNIGSNSNQGIYGNINTRQTSKNPTIGFSGGIQSPF